MTNELWSSPHGTIALPTAILPHTRVPGEKAKDVTSVSWSPCGQLLATGCYDGLARIWENSGALRFVLQEHTGPVFSLKWNKTGSYLLSGSYDHRAIVWDVVTGTKVKVLQLHTQPVLDVDWKDANIFATCSSDM